MSGSDPERLISLYLFNQTSMTSEQVAQLSEWLTQDPSHVRHYLASVRFHSTIREYFSANDAARKAVFEEGAADMDPAVLEGELMQLLVMEKRSPSLEVRRPSLEEAESPVERAFVPSPRPKVSRFWLSISLASVAAILLLVLWRLWRLL